MSEHDAAPSFSRPRSSAAAWGARGIVLVLLLAAGWGAGLLLRSPGSHSWRPRGGKLRVLTTILPLYDFAREVGGPNVEVRNLLPPGVDPHEFALAPHDVALVSGADLLVVNGAGLDDFLTGAVARAGARDRPLVVASEGLPLLASAERDHGHETGDPHLWLDPGHARVYAQRIARAITVELERRGRGQAARSVAERAARFDGRLARLDDAFGRRLSPVRGRSFVAFHGAFQYLAARYGLRIAAIWQSTPGKEPAPREVGGILRAARSGHVRALFCEPQFSPRAIEMVAADARLPVYTLDPYETAPDLDRADYVSVMSTNLETLARAMGADRSGPAAAP